MNKDLDDWMKREAQDPLKKTTMMNGIINDILDRDWMDDFEILAFIEDEHIGNPFF